MLMDGILAKLSPAEKESLLNQIMLAQERGKVTGAKENSWTALFNGAKKSWTVWLGIVVMLWPQIETPLHDVLASVFPGLTASIWTSLTTIAGALIIALRAKTTEPLESRGEPK